MAFINETGAALSVDRGSAALSVRNNCQASAIWYVVMFFLSLVLLEMSRAKGSRIAPAVIAERKGAAVVEGEHRCLPLRHGLRRPSRCRAGRRAAVVTDYNVDRNDARRRRSLIGSFVGGGREPWRGAPTRVRLWAGSEQVTNSPYQLPICSLRAEFR